MSDTILVTDEGNYCQTHDTTKQIFSLLHICETFRVLLVNYSANYLFFLARLKKTNKTIKTSSDLVFSSCLWMPLFEEYVK